MKRLIGAIAVWIWAAGCCLSASPALVQINSAANGNTASLSSSALTVTAGNMLLVLAVGAGSNVASYQLSISDTQGTSFTQAVAGGYESAQFSGHLWAWYAPNITGGADTITLSYPSGTNFIQLHVLEVSGIATVTPLDKTGTNSVSSSTSTTVSTSAAITQSSEYVVGFFNDWTNYATWTAGSGYTTINTFTTQQESKESLVEELNSKAGLSGIQTATATLNFSDTTQGMILAFKAASAASVPPPMPHPVVF